MGLSDDASRRRNHPYHTAINRNDAFYDTMSAGAAYSTTLLGVYNTDSSVSGTQTHPKTGAKIR
jgi:hypothetical protein